MPRVAVGIEYLGTNYVGWQLQAGQRSVQGAVEAALSAVANGPVRTICAGRTDAGVHALGQVVHFDTPAERAARAWVLGANTRLPPDIALTWAREMPPDFHARFGAVSRTYHYHILNRSERPALAAGRVSWVRRPLEVARMNLAAAHLLGEHDFNAFRALECQSRTPVRRVTALAVCREGERVTIAVTANAFLHHMVRNIVGSLVYVGAGRQPPAWIGELLAARDRRRAAPTFAPDGLYLSAIEYDPSLGLPAFRPSPLLPLP